MVFSTGSNLSVLQSLGQRLRVISNNIANVGTSGYKTARAVLSQGQANSVTVQISESGRNAVGVPRPTDSPTDLALNGPGYFTVRDQGGQGFYHTRSGHFQFNQAGQLVTPEGQVVQGWSLDETGQPSGAMGDIQLSGLNAAPQETHQVRLVGNLDAGAPVSGGALDAAWDGTADTPLPDNAYSYQTSVAVHDPLGQGHDLTVYYAKQGPNRWDFLVTTSPDADKRSFLFGPADSRAGLLARGTLSFSADSGTLRPDGLSLERLEAGGWTPATANEQGYYEVRPDFISGGNGSQRIGLDLGSRWNGSAWVNEAQTTTQYSRPATTTLGSADGYGAGALTGVSVGRDGIITGEYSHGRRAGLHQIALSQFPDPQGLSKIGGNLYQATHQSGAAVYQAPLTNGLRGITPNALEMSQVDPAQEIPRAMLTRRHYEANLKMVALQDDLQKTVIDIVE